MVHLVCFYTGGSNVESTSRGFKGQDKFHTSKEAALEGNWLLLVIG